MLNTLKERSGLDVVWVHVQISDALTFMEKRRAQSVERYR